MKASGQDEVQTRSKSGMTEEREQHDPLLYGANEDSGLVAVELQEAKTGPDQIVLFVRDGNEVREEKEAFEPFMVGESRVFSDCPIEHTQRMLTGQGQLKLLVTFPSWKQCQKARQWVAKETGCSPAAPGAPYFFVNDPIRQHLITTGRTHFLGMAFEDLRRMQVDIECLTSEGYEFCNSAREGDRIIAIAMSDQSGWTEVLSVIEMEEKDILERFVKIVQERDPDVIEGHNIFNFDLPYIAERAKRHKVKLALGRNGSTPRRRPSRMSVAERTLSYDRFDIFGRHVVDTLFLVQAYDVSHRSLDGFGLKQVAVHFGLAARDRTYIEGSQITAEFKKDPERVMKYVTDDVVETRAVSDLLSRSTFLQAQMLPDTYQNVSVRGAATKIDGIMLREYLRQDHALPVPGEPRAFAGGYTDMFVEGVVNDVHHCDIRSLYPSLMLTRTIAPASDELKVFLRLLDVLRTFRIDAKAKMQASRDRSDEMHYDALQTTFKILINSFYGYLGFSQGRFNDFDSAERVTSDGRDLLRDMIEWLRKHGATPIEIDTDGIYFVPPSFEGDGKKRATQLEEFREKFAASLPDGIQIEFDGEYRAMYSYKMKNYALLGHDGEMVIKGGALKSRGLEPFQREFLREMIRSYLEGEADHIPLLKAEYEAAIRDHQWPIERLAKTETLQESLATYAGKIGEGRRGKSATYELALKSGREYRTGDQISYYVTGNKKSVAVHAAGKLVTDWNPEDRDENVPYYLAKLESLYKKFGCPETAQGEFKLEG